MIEDWKMKSIFLSENIRFNATLRNVSVDMLSSYRIVEPPAIFVPLALRVPYPRQGELPISLIIINCPPCGSSRYKCVLAI